MTGRRICDWSMEQLDEPRGTCEVEAQLVLLQALGNLAGKRTIQTEAAGPVAPLMSDSDWYSAQLRAAALDPDLAREDAMDQRARNETTRDVRAGLDSLLVSERLPKLSGQLATQEELVREFQRLLDDPFQSKSVRRVSNNDS